MEHVFKIIDSSMNVFEAREIYRALVDEVGEGEASSNLPSLSQSEAINLWTNYMKEHPPFPDQTY